MLKFGIIWKGTPEDLAKLKESLLAADRDVLSTVSAANNESLVFVKDGFALSHKPERR